MKKTIYTLTWYSEHDGGQMETSNAAHALAELSRLQSEGYTVGVQEREFIFTAFDSA